MSKPRKKYRPRPVLLDPVSYVIRGFMPVNAVGDTVRALRYNVHAAALALAKGEADHQDLDFLVTASNVSEALARSGFGAEHEHIVQTAQAAIQAICERERPIAKGPELTAINALIELHDAQFDIATLGELEKAVRLVAKEVQAKRARVIKAHHAHA